MRSRVHFFAFFVITLSAFAYGQNCKDNSRWRTTEGNKDCSWVRKNRLKRCEKWGKVGSRASGAQRACKASCYTCPCVDSESWRYKNENTGKNEGCDWIRKRKKRCEKIGRDGTVASLSCRFSCNTCPVLTEKKLMDLFHSTGGESWSENENWGKFGVEYCDWFGVTCDENQIRVNLADNNLTGSIPTEIGSFNDQLLALDLSNNKISGTIPSEIGQLVSAIRFNVLDNNISGPIPSEIGLMEAMKVFQLRENYLTGSIPSEIGMMKEATAINLSNNNISGTIPSEIGGLSNLNVLILNENDMTGSIPTEVCLLDLKNKNFYVDDEIDKCF